MKTRYGMVVGMVAVLALMLNGCAHQGIYEKAQEVFEQQVSGEEGRRLAFTLIAGTSNEIRSNAEIDAYYKELARYAPNEDLKGAVGVLAERWQEIFVHVGDDKRLGIHRHEEVTRAAEVVWSYTQTQMGRKKGVYLRNLKDSPIKIRVVIDELHEIVPARLPFERRVERLFSYIDELDIVDKDADIHDATLHVTSRSIPLKQRYEHVGAGRTPTGSSSMNWTGATVEGHIALAVGVESAEWDFSGTIYPPKTISTFYSHPSKAPFRKAFHKGFVLGLYKAAGTMDLSFLLTILDVPEGRVMFYNPPRRIEDKKIAAQALGTLGDPRAIDALVKSARNDDYRVRKAAVKALVAIGGSRAKEELVSIHEESAGVRSYGPVRRFDEAVAEAVKKLGYNP